MMLYTPEIVVSVNLIVIRTETNPQIVDIANKAIIISQ